MNERRPGFVLSVMRGTYAICRLPAGASVPDVEDDAAFLSVTRSADETSVVCDQRSIPDGAVSDGGWRVLKVEGPLDLGTVGVIAHLSAARADAGVALFVVSTFDTDYLLVREASLSGAVAALRRAGDDVRLPG